MSGQKLKRKLKKLKQEWRWLEQRHMERRRDSRGTIGSKVTKKGQEEPVTLSMGTGRVRAETSCFMGSRAGTPLSSTEQGLQTQIFLYSFVKRRGS